MNNILWWCWRFIQASMVGIMLICLHRQEFLPLSLAATVYVLICFRDYAMMLQQQPVFYGAVLGESYSAARARMLKAKQAETEAEYEQQINDAYNAGDTDKACDLFTEYACKRLGCPREFLVGTLTKKDAPTCNT